MISFLICFGLSFAETALYASTMEVLVETKDWYKKHRWLYISIATLFFVIEAYTLATVFYVRMVTTVLMYIIIAWLIVKAKTAIKLSVALTFHNYLVMVECSIMLCVVKITMYRNIDPSLVYDYYELHMIVAEVLLNTILVILCCKNRGRFIETMKLLRDREWINILLITIFSSLILTIMVKESGMQEHYYVDLMVICIDVAIVFLDFAIVGLFIQSLQKQKHIVENEETIERQKRRSHEFDNRMNAIKGMLDSGRIEELQDYLNEISKKDLPLSPEINTNHVIINTIMNAKHEEARQKDISFIMKINDLSGITIADDDLVVLLSNLLNNAIEACDKSKEKIIKIKFVIEDKQIILAVKNSIKTTPTEMNGELVTSKTQNIEEHGVGLKNVKDIIDKCKGRYVIDYDDNYFTFSSIIPL